VERLEHHPQQRAELETHHLLAHIVPRQVVVVALLLTEASVQTVLAAPGRLAI
jgi:hypothetical protein